MAHTSRACEAEPSDALGPTRSSRLGGASPISFSFYSDSGRTLELGRSGRNAGAIGASAARYGVFANSPLATALTLGVAFLLFIHCLARTRAAPA
jgi:hypothetical protein